MYILFGIIVVLIKREATPEFFHLKQATGRWMLFVLFLIVSIVLLFVPLLQLLPLAIMTVVLIIWAIFVSQARKGKFYIVAKEAPIPVFTGIGSRFYELFDFSFDESGMARM